MEISRYCVECGLRIAGRTDKRFCNDQCRTAWHNKQYAVDNRPVKGINSILRRNRRILAGLTAGGKRQIRSGTLIKLGFKFEYFTSARKRRGLMEHFCYDQVYVPVANGVYLLKRTDHDL